MSRHVTITAPSRLHFGLFALGGSAGRQYGGVGAMIDQPTLQLSMEPAQGWSCAGPLAERASEFAERWRQFNQLPQLPACSTLIQAAPASHVGLGVGTQLGLAIAAGLNAFCGLPAAPPLELALSVGRGLRSAVGTYGFVMGGLIVEQGKLPSEPISTLDCRLDLPDEWRFVLVRPLDGQGLSGEAEAAAMNALPDVPEEVTQRLIGEAREELIPAAATADFAAFARSLYRYGHLAGSCFAARQGGPYNGPVLADLIERLQRLGAQGVGQSSWGPTIFAAQPSQAEAEALSQRLREEPNLPPLEILIAAPCNQGARVELALCWGAAT